jgi:protein tyrosine/serine phosphatase
MTLEVSQIKSHIRRRRRWVLVAGLIVMVAAGIWVWVNVFKDQIIPKNFGVVEQGSIYRSGQLSAALVKRVLAERNIRVVVNLTGESFNDVDQLAEKYAVAELGIKQIRLPLRGNGTGDINNYARAIAAIVDARKKNLPVLVHCGAGAQRAGGVIAAYRLLVQKKDPNFVKDELEHYGCAIDDKPELFTYLNSNMSELALRLKKSGVIDEIPSPLPQIPRD